MKMQLKTKGLDQYIASLAKLPDNMHRRVLRAVMNVGTEPLLRAARAGIPKGTLPTDFNIRGTRYKRAQRLATTMIKKIRTYPSLVGVGVVGSASRSAPHGHFVSGGTGDQITSPPPRRSHMPRRGTREYHVPAGKILRIPIEHLQKYSRKPIYGIRPGAKALFIRGKMDGSTIIRNKGSRPNPWLQVATQRAEREAIAAMEKKFGEELVKAMK